MRAPGARRADTPLFETSRMMRSRLLHSRVRRAAAAAGVLLVCLAAGCGLRDSPVSPPAPGTLPHLATAEKTAPDTTRAATDTLSLAKYDTPVSLDSMLTVTALIPAETGGYLNLGTAVLTVPPRALERDTEISLSMSSGTFVEYAIEPTGLTFRVPVEFCVKYDRTTAKSPDGGSFDIVLAWFDPSRSEWVSLASETDGTVEKVSAQLSHLSYYALAKKTRPRQSDGARTAQP